MTRAYLPRMSDEREKFSQRLANAMQQAGYEPRPKVLFNLFNILLAVLVLF